MMIDRIDKEHRSWNMSQIRSKNTKPEIAVRKTLHRLGYRFRLHCSELPGTPDIVLPRYKTVVFVHGCYWHRHQGCKYAYLPKSRESFWAHKFKGNVARDIQHQAELMKMGWNVGIIWECEIEDESILHDRINRIFANAPIG